MFLSGFQSRYFYCSSFSLNSSLFCENIIVRENTAACDNITLFCFNGGGGVKPLSWLVSSHTHFPLFFFYISFFFSIFFFFYVVVTIGAGERFPLFLAQWFFLTLTILLEPKIIRSLRLHEKLILSTLSSVCAFVDLSAENRRFL